MRPSLASPAPSKTRFTDLPPARIHLLADDLTGACDAAASFLLSSHSVRVWLGSEATHTPSESVQAFNTNSRTLPPEQAAAVVTRSIASLPVVPDAVLFKKVDSVLRGPIAAELLAAHRALGTQAILFAPSFPSAGRTVRDGILQIEDSSGRCAEVTLESLFSPQYWPLLTVIRKPNEVAPALEAGKTILLCDAETEADLEALIRATVHIPGLLYAGSAGLARAVASLNPGTLPPRVLPLLQRTLVVVGTAHPVTALQLDALAESHPHARVLRIRCEAGDDASVQAAFQQFDPDALILTGGDTALLALRALSADSLILRGEFAPGIPWGIVQGGAAQGRVVITKSGGFGAPTAFTDILNALSGRA
jgi:uncharacterized protein YgbK (DUF1537 family)